MKVTFVHSPNGLQKFSAAVAAISAWIKQYGHTTKLILVETDTTEDEFKQQVRDTEPDIVACTTMSFQWEMLQDLARWVKDVREDLPIVVGGYHPTGSPDIVMTCKDVNYICRGEGEEAMQDLLEALERGDHEAIKTIPNIWSRDPEDPELIHKNEIRPLIPDLDILPDWDRELFNMDELLAASNKASLYHGKFHLPAYTGRGCPYHCTYCCNSELMGMYKGLGSFVRRRSPKVAVDELARCKERYHVDFIEFWDEEFDMPEAQMREFADDYKKRVGLPFAIFKTASLGRLENMQLLKDMGCTRILVGVECGDEEYRRKVLKKPISNDEFVAFFDAVHEMGFETISSNMINMPGETPAHVEATIELNRRLRPTSLFFFRFVPFPGTELYDIAREEGFLPEWQDFWYESKKAGLELPTLPKDKLLELEERFRELQAECEMGNHARSFHG